MRNKDREPVPDGADVSGQHLIDRRLGPGRTGANFQVG